jgi:hypothetical protein
MELSANAEGLLILATFVIVLIHFILHLVGR